MWRVKEGRGVGRFTRNVVWTLCAFVCVSGCVVRSCEHSAETPEESVHLQTPPATKGIDMVDQLKAEVERLATPEGRMVGTPGHDAARRYLLERITETRLEPCRHSDSFELPFDVDGVKFVNVIARLPGRNPDLPPILIAAHYDTCGPLPGADDNAAAIAIALAVVEPLRARQPERDVLFAFFDSEEPPYFLTPSMGSVHWYNHQRSGPVHCAIALDLVGHDVPVPGLEDVLALTGVESDSDLAQVVRDCEPKQGLRTVATLNRYIGDLSDHHVFRINQRPYLLLTCAHWPHYHEPTDTPEKLNYTKMAAIADYLVRIVAAIDTKPLAGPFEGYDSTDVELYFFRKTLGPLVSGLGLRLESREDIEAVTKLMLEQFGL